MKRIFLYSVLGVSLLISCQDINEVEKPENLIGREKMVDILYDLSLIDATTNTSRIKSDKDFEPKSYIFQKYDIDSAQLAGSHAYYLYKFEIGKMYEEVRLRLKAEKKILDSLAIIADSLEQNKSESIETDSLKNTKKENFKILPPQKVKKISMIAPVPTKDTLK